MKLSVLNTVAERLADVSEQVNARVVTALVEVELVKRGEAILAGIEKARKMESDLYRLKPDQRSLDGAGNLISETYSEAKYKERKELTEKLGKLTDALTAAVDKGEMDKLYNLVKNG
jgi:hypothetical protein